MAEVCRVLNGMTLDDCIGVRCRYYLNPRRGGYKAIRVLRLLNPDMEVEGRGLRQAGEGVPRSTRAILQARRHARAVPRDSRRNPQKMG